jgi:hypothetical protein
VNGTAPSGGENVVIASPPSRTSQQAFFRLEAAVLLQHLYRPGVDVDLPGPAGESETYLWPGALPSQRRTEVARSEIVQVYPHRSSVPADLWDSLLDKAATYVDILVYVGMFMTEMPDLPKTLREKATNGARIRLLFGDRDAPAVTQRSIDEGIGEHTIAAKIDHALAFFSVLSGVPGIEVRTHGTVLYNSIYRFDDEMIVNPHVYGKVASHAPALHLRRLSAGDLFTIYEDSFTAVWEAAARQA